MTTIVADSASPIRVDAPLPSASAIRAIADDVIAQVKYSFTSQAAGIAPKTPGQLDKAAAAFMATRSAKARAQYQAKAHATLALPAKERSAALGRFAGITAYTGSDELHKLVPMAKLDAHTLETQFKAFAADLNHKPKAKKPDPGLKYTKLHLLIDSVHCIEETSGIFEGSDEIALGGTATGPRGVTALIPQFMVSNDFDQGETVNYPGGKRIVTWNIDKDKDWPHVYGAVIAMSEKDDGGFGDWLKALWDGVSAKVKQAISSAVAGGLAAALGAALGGVIGALAGLIVGILIGWIVDLFDNPDDICGAHVVTVTLADDTKDYYDWAKLTSANGWMFDMNFTGDGGHYLLKGAFKVATS